MINMNRTLRLLALILFSLFSIHISICSAAKDEFPHIISATSVNQRGAQVTKYGFANENGERIVDPIYEKVSPFSSVGLALVYRDGYYGYVDTKGEFFMPVGLKEARPFNQFGLAIIKHARSKWSVIDTQKYIIVKEIFDKIEDYQSNGLAIVKYEGKYGLVDTLGNVVLPVIYDKVDNFDKSGYAYIKSGNKIGVVDKRGRTIVPAEHKDKKSAMAAISSRPKFGNLQDLVAAENSRNQQNTDDQKKLAEQKRKEEEQRLLASQKQKEEEQERLLAEQKEKEEEQQILLAEQKQKEEEYQKIIAERQKRKEEQDKALAEQKQKEEQEKQQKLLAEQKQKEEQEKQQKLLAEQKRKEEEQRQAEARKRLEETPTLNNYIAANLGDWADYLASKDINVPSDEEIRNFIEEEVSKWQIKGEFEPTAKWKERVNETTRTAKINAMADSIFSVNSKNVENVRAEYRKKYEALVDKYCAGIAEQFASQTLEIKPYDADNETFLISTSDFGDFLLPVPLDEAPGFKQEWDKWKSAAIASFVPNGEDVVLKSVSIGKYKYDSDMNATYAQVDVDYNFKPVDVAQLNRRLGDEDNLAMNSSNNSSANQNKGFNTTKVKISAGTTPDTDINIPSGSPSSTPTFAVVIANGDYQHASKVNHAENDGKVMTQYLTRTLGIPEGNVATFINATYGQMASAISMLQDIGDAYAGSDFNIMFYYVGHGLPDDEGKKSYILPVDIDPRQVSICMPLEKIYADLGNLGAKNVTVMVDACFSGTNHGDGMLIPQSMGVAMKPKSASPVGNMVVMAAADGNETAFPYEEKSHGLFTYWILKKLQETSGKVTFGELSDFVIDNVKKTSVTVNKKPQTPNVATSPQLANTWRNLQFGN